jgi:hypothetical protein
MKTFQNFIFRIEQYKIRTNSSTGPWENLAKAYHVHIIAIDAYLKQTQDDSIPLSKFILRSAHVLSVSFIQDVTRLFVKSLVDKDFEYMKRLVSKKYKLDFDIEYLNVFLEKKVSLGDYVAHIVIPNSLEDLARLYVTLTGEDFYQGLEACLDDLQSDSERKMNFGRVVEELKLGFSTRHIVAHELSEIDVCDSSHFYGGYHVFMVTAIFLEEAARRLLLLDQPSGQIMTG